jgi:CRISPR/Cas system-associated endonuclease Cas3-HD
MKKVKISDIDIEKIEKGYFTKKFPELYQLKKVVENNEWHNNESVFNHTLTVLKNLEKILKNAPPKISKYLNKKVDNYSRKDLLFLAAIFHDLGKKDALIKNNNKTSCPKHESISVKKTKKIFNNFDLSKREEMIINQVIKNHTSMYDILSPSNKNLSAEYRKFKVNQSNVFLEISLLCMADTTGSYLKETNPEEFKFRMDFYNNILKNY